MRWAKLGPLLGVAVLLHSTSVLAHSEGNLSSGFAGGLIHPLLGADHVAAMVAVGLWGAILGRPAVVVLPVVFPLIMALGGVWAIRGLPLAGTEIGVAISAIVLGIMIALALRPPLIFAGLIVAAFAIFHGYAHGAELPSGADAAAFSIGFVLATGMLHLTGIMLGTLVKHRGGMPIARAAGAMIAAIGVWFLWVRI